MLEYELDGSERYVARLTDVESSDFIVWRFFIQEDPLVI